eukprot:1905461-Pyramimonas_sp.AAC.1
MSWPRAVMSSSNSFHSCRCRAARVDSWRPAGGMPRWARRRQLSAMARRCCSPRCRVRSVS